MVELLLHILVVFRMAYHRLKTFHFYRRLIFATLLQFLMELSEGELFPYSHCAHSDVTVAQRRGQPQHSWAERACHIQPKIFSFKVITTPHLIMLHMVTYCHIAMSKLGTAYVMRYAL